MCVPLTEREVDDNLMFSEMWSDIAFGVGEISRGRAPLYCAYCRPWSLDIFRDRLVVPFPEPDLDLRSSAFDHIPEQSTVSRVVKMSTKEKRTIPLRSHWILGRSSWFGWTWHHSLNSQSRRHHNYCRESVFRRRLTTLVKCDKEKDNMGIP